MEGKRPRIFPVDHGFVAKVFKVFTAVCVVLGLTVLVSYWSTNGFVAGFVTGVAITIASLVGYSFSTEFQEESNRAKRGIEELEKFANQQEEL